MASTAASPRISPVWLVVGGILSVQVGAAIAKGFFDEVSPTTMVWLRLASSAVMLGLVVRPRLRGHTGADWLAAIGFGLTLLIMNWSFYQSFARIPLGIAVTIEFIGPLGLAVALSRRARDLIWVALAGLGVVLLGAEPADLNVAGVGFALLAGLAWAAYILLSAATGARWPGLDGLAVASIVAAVLLTPALAYGGHAGELDLRIVAIGTAVGLLSSVIPYTFEIKALRHLPPRVFGILMSLEPAAAALAAMVILSEFLSWPHWLAIGCVVAASVGATRSARKRAAEVHTAVTPQ